MKTEQTTQERQPIKLKPGMRVTIFHDPLSQKTPEGEAVLKRALRPCDDEVQRWEVLFDGEGRTVERFVSNWKWKQPEIAGSGALLSRALAFALIALTAASLSGCCLDDYVNHKPRGADHCPLPPGTNFPH